MYLIPGQTVRVVLDTDRWTDKSLVFDAVVREVKGESLILALMGPLAPGSMQDQEVVVTYIVEEERGPVRYGFPAVVTASLDDGGSTDDPLRPALLVTRKAEPASFSIRTCLRVEPTEVSRLDLYVGDAKVNISDVSLGGVKFSFQGSLPPEADNRVQLRFDLAGEGFDVRATVLRSWYGKKRTCFVVAEFASTTGRFEQALARRIRKIERDRRF